MDDLGLSVNRSVKRVSSSLFFVFFLSMLFLMLFLVLFLMLFLMLCFLVAFFVFRLGLLVPVILLNILIQPVKVIPVPLLFWQLSDA